jgi:DNA-binding transcriptional LysR family regulator
MNRHCQLGTVAVMELRQLEAFVSVATELHFGRAAERLHMSQPTLSELVRRLERELGVTLLIRTTRRVTLTEAGARLLQHSQPILDQVAGAALAVRYVARGEEGTVRLGFTPPAAPVLIPHLRSTFAETAPGIEIVESWLWLPALLQAVQEGAIDVAITCARLDGAARAVDEVFCSQPLLVGLRPGDRRAERDAVDVRLLADRTLGTTAETLFPAWALAQRQALRRLNVEPRRQPLSMPDLHAARWLDQPEIDWIMLIGSLTLGHVDTEIRPVLPRHDVPFTLRWQPHRATSPAVPRFVEHVLTMPPPPGWSSGRR